MRHDAQAPRAENRKVKDGITLLTETSERIALSYATVSGDGVADSKEDGLADKREEDYVVGDEDEVEPALAISWVRGVIRW